MKSDFRVSLLTHEHCESEQFVPTEVRTFVQNALKKSVQRSKTSTRVFRGEFALLMRDGGWTNPIRVSSKSRITITSTKADIGLCVQTGNMGRLYADILKLQTLYKLKSIKAAIFVLPQKQWSKKMGSNIACYERLVEELGIFSETITVPILVVGFSGEA